MSAAREVERDLVPLTDRHDSAGEHTRALIGWIALQHQHAHAGVIVVHHRALCRLPDQLIPRRLDHLRFFLDDLPLRGRRQRDT
jgi:hypothetical protein